MEIFYKALAEADAQKQADFFNGFYRHLRIICKRRHELQMAYVADHLDVNGREFATSLAEFAKLAVETRSKVETEIGDLYQQQRELEREIARKREQLEAVNEQPA